MQTYTYKIVLPTGQNVIQRATHRWLAEFTVIMITDAKGVIHMYHMRNVVTVKMTPEYEEELWN